MLSGADGLHPHSHSAQVLQDKLVDCLGNLGNTRNLGDLGNRGGPHNLNNLAAKAA